MQRRNFFKLLAATAASQALATFGQTAQEGRLPLPSGLEHYTQDYAQFCAMPPDKRIFYHLSGGRIVEEKLDNAKWKPGGGDPAKLPLPSGWWDNVPLQSPFPNLSGDGPYRPTWDSLLEYEAPV